MNKKINEFRKSKNLTADEFAKKLGYSSSTIIKVLYGERDPGRRFLEKLKEVFPDADMNYFFTAKTTFCVLKRKG